MLDARRALAALATGLAAAGTAHARDEPELSLPPSRPAHARVEVGAGGHLALLFGDQCERTASDVTGCTAGGGLFGAQVTPRFALSPHWYVGMRGAVSASGDASTRETWWHAGAEGRFRADGVEPTGPWLGVDAGVVLVDTKVRASDLGPEGSATEEAPMFGLSVGTDLALGRYFTLGPELRGFVAAFGPVDYSVSRGTSHGTAGGIALALTGTLLTAR